MLEKLLGKAGAAELQQLMKGHAETQRSIANSLDGIDAHLAGIEDSLSAFVTILEAEKAEHDKHKAECEERVMKRRAQRKAERGRKKAKKPAPQK